MIWWWIAGVVLALLLLRALIDVVQRQHTILHNFPLLGHLRYLLEAVGPELRQYIVTNNEEERPFSRDQRRWVYASSKLENNYFGFGSDNDMDKERGHIIVKHVAFPLEVPVAGGEHYDPDYWLPCGKVLGKTRKRKHAFRPQSLVYCSGMSFGALSSTAIESLNKGCKLVGCLHNTGEGSVSPYHQHGADLIWQIGTGYFGCRDQHGGFEINRFKQVVEENPVRCIEIKLSQGAKPGKGGILPAEKITAEIATIRGIPRNKDCLSPAGHTVFSDADGLLDFVEKLASVSGLPVGIKSAVGDMGFWKDLTRLMKRGNRGVDFVTIDGGEGGTGAAPLVFTDHVSMPFKTGFNRVHRVFAEAGLVEKVVFIGSGRLGLPSRAIMALALGCDMIAVARESMLAIGCIQAQRCHTGSCPSGVATQNRWLKSGLDPNLKSVRFANYIVTLRKELLLLSYACGQLHPSLIPTDQFELLDGGDAISFAENYQLKKNSCLLSKNDQESLKKVIAQHSVPPEEKTKVA